SFLCLSAGIAETDEAPTISVKAREDFMRKALLLLAAICLCVLGVARATAQEAKDSLVKANTTPTIDQSLEMKSAFNPRISPDGLRVVYELVSTNWEDNSFDRNLWIVDVAGGEARPLTTAKKSSTNADWSPDGKWIAFLSDRPAQLTGSPAEKRQLYVIAADGGEAQQVTKGEKDVSGFEWAPDSKRLAFSTSDAEPKALKDRKEKYGEFSVVHADYQMTHLWTIELPQGASGTLTEAKRLTEGNSFSVGTFSWSPDGTKIAFNATRDPDLISGFSSDIYVLTVSDNSVKKIVDTAGPDRNPKWSPGGTKIAYETAAGSKYFFYTNAKIAVVSADGGTPQVLTEAFDEDPGLLAWGPDGIYFDAVQKTHAHLYRLNPATKAIEKLSAPERLVGQGFSFSRDYKTVAFRGADENEYAEIYVGSLAPWQAKKLTTMSDQLKPFKVAHREVIFWKSTDGTTIEGVLYTPPDFKV